MFFAENHNLDIMNELLRTTNQMSWGEPILPIVVDRAWEAEVVADIGQLPDLCRRLAPSKWLREAILKWPRIPVSEFPKHLGDIGSLVTAQENACRYCYGVARSYLRMFGHSEKAISRIEREMQFGELDDKERVFMQAHPLAHKSQRTDTSRLFRAREGQARLPGDN
jgi:hypothetical protein